VFVRDLTAETTTRLSVADDGAQLDGASFALSPSDDGRRVAFRTLATSPPPTSGPPVAKARRRRAPK